MANYNRRRTRNNSRRKPRQYNGSMIYVKNNQDTHKHVKDGVFALTGGKKSLLIKGEGKNISTAVDVAETLRRRLFPGIEVADISLSSRPFYNNNKRRRKRSKNKFEKNIISNIEILLETKTYT